MRILTIAAAIGALAIAALAAPAQADTIGYTRASSNAAENVASQLTTKVTFDGSTASFEFLNDVGTASSLTAVYFRSTLGSVLDLAGITESDISTSSGVVFEKDATPKKPAGQIGTDWGGKAGVGFSMDPDASGNGINSSDDWVTVTIDLIDGKNASDVLAALDTSGVSKSILAFHVQSIGTGGESDWFYNDSMTPVPEPGSLVLMCLGLVGAGMLRRRRKRLLSA